MAPTEYTIIIKLISLQIESLQFLPKKKPEGFCLPVLKKLIKD